METLEAEALRLPGVNLKVHRYGGTEFMQKEGHQLGHLHGHGLLDVLVGQEEGAALIAAHRVSAHHVFPHSKWISFQIESTADVPFALELLHMAQSNGISAASSASELSPIENWKDGLRCGGWRTAEGQDKVGLAWG